jgi:hypothetical protein
MRPVRIEVITYTPTFFYHCQHCELTFREMGVGQAVHREQAREALPEDLTREFAAVSSWLHELLERHGGRIRIKLVDAASLEGFWKSLRHGIKSYPAILIDGTEKHVGIDLLSLDSTIDDRVRRSSERLAIEEPEKGGRG